MILVDDFKGKTVLIKYRIWQNKSICWRMLAYRFFCILCKINKINYSFIYRLYNCSIEL